MFLRQNKLQKFLFSQGKVVKESTFASTLSQNNLNLCIKTEPVTVGANVKEYLYNIVSELDMSLYIIYMCPKARHGPLLPPYSLDRLGFY